MEQQQQQIAYEKLKSGQELQKEQSYYIFWHDKHAYKLDAYLGKKKKTSVTVLNVELLNCFSLQS